MGSPLLSRYLFRIKSKSTAVILCILLLNELILEGICDKSAAKKKGKGDDSDDGVDAEDEDDDKGEGEDDHDEDDDPSMGAKVADHDSGGGKGGKKGKGSKGGKGGKHGLIGDNGLPELTLPKAGRKIGKIPGTGSRRKKTMGGLSRVLDDRIVQFDRYGEPHLGMPQDAFGHIIYCAQFVYSGLLVLLFLTIRYPLKIVLKAVVGVGAIGHLMALANRCVNPLVILSFAADGVKHNAHLARLSQFREQCKRRFIFTADKAEHRDRQMWACCSLYEWYLQSYAEAPEILPYTKRYFIGFYKLGEIVYCLKYQQGSSACEEADLTIPDQPTDRVIPQSVTYLCCEVLNKFV